VEKVKKFSTKLSESENFFLRSLPSNFRFYR